MDHILEIGSALHSSHGLIRTMRESNNKVIIKQTTFCVHFDDVQSNYSLLLIFRFVLFLVKNVIKCFFLVLRRMKYKKKQQHRKSYRKSLINISLRFNVSQKITWEEAAFRFITKGKFFIAFRGLSGSCVQMTSVNISTQSESRFCLKSFYLRIFLKSTNLI